jgi:hypothetical protein
VAVQAYYGLPMLIVSTIVVAIVYRAIEAHWFYIGIDLVREKPGGKRFGLWTRLMFYIDCPTLYHDVWHKVCIRFFKPVFIGRKEKDSGLMRRTVLKDGQAGISANTRHTKGDLLTAHIHEMGHITTRQGAGHVGCVQRDVPARPQPGR